MTSSRSPAVEIVDQEIKWHEEHSGTSGEGSDYERGFVDALKHTQKLLRKAEV